MLNNSDEKLFVETHGKKAVNRKLVAVLMVVTLVVGFLIGYLVSMSIHRKSQDSKENPAEYESFHKMIKDGISNKQIEQHLKTFTNMPHRAGGKNSQKFAEMIQTLWKSFGITDVEIVPYKVMLSKPKRAGIITIKNKKTNATIFTSSRNETEWIPEEHVERVLPFNAYSASKNVTGELIYVNYATPSDFMLLKTLNITVKGKIILCRYGKIFRANKVEQAEAAGAIGVVIFSDPADYSLGSVKYPDSWWLPRDGVQRGTVNHLDADPQTIGYPAIDGIYRTPENKTDTPKIPVHPISYSDAFQIMQRLDGLEAPKKWQGRMNLTYRINCLSNSTSLFSLSVDVVNEENTPIYNVIGKIEGVIEPDRFLLLGNHHDAWVMGGLDPASGTAVLTDIVRSAGAAVKKGWKPRRSIMFCSWDAEEYGLIGSTEWIEDHASFVSNQVVAYLNVDSATEGNFTLTAKASSQLASALFKAADKVQDPDRTGDVSLFSTWKKKVPERGNEMYPRIRIPGSGSDFKTFFVRYGVPVTDIRFDFDWDVVGHIASSPNYHSLHDTFYYVKHFVDPDFSHSAAVGKVWASVAAILADSAVLPFNFTDYGRRLKICHDKFKKKYVASFSSLAQKRFGYVSSAVEQFNNVSMKFHGTLQKVDEKNTLQVRMFNDKMMSVERAFIAPQGLPGRPYIRHVLYGPSKFNSYRGNCFPSLVDDMLDAKYNSRSNEERLLQDISQVYYHLLQGIQAISL